jgi:hypothetical protein
MLKKLLAVMLFAALAGCGDDNDNGAPAAPPPPEQPGTASWTQVAFLTDCIPDNGCEFDGTLTLKADGSYSATDGHSGQLTQVERDEIIPLIDQIAKSDLSRESCESGIGVPEINAVTFTLTYQDGRTVKFFDFSQDRGRCTRGDPALIEELSTALESVGD